MKQILRDYQVKAISDLRNEVKRVLDISSEDEVSGVILVAATGSGKTTIASHIIESAISKGTKCLFLAHRKELIEQASVRLDEHGIDHGIIKAGNKRVNNLPIQVASIATLVRRLHKKYDFDFVVIDECHRTPAKSYMKVLFSFPGCFVLGLTATPYRTDGRGLGGIYKAIIRVSSTEELTERGFLVPARYFSTPMLPELAGVKTLGGDWEHDELAKRVDKPKLVGDIYHQWVKHAMGRRTVVFGVSRSHAYNIYQLFVQNGVPWAYLDGKTPERERMQILDNIKTGTIQGISNVGVLTEGWDCPVVSCISIARPTKSLGLYLQMAGRALRPFPGKVDCVLLDHGGNVARHGFIADVQKYSLDVDKKITNTVKSVSTCPKCFCNYRGKICPECGYKKPLAPNQLPEEIDGELVEISPIEIRNIQKSYYDEMLKMQLALGYSNRWAAVKFKHKFGVWPSLKITGNIWKQKNFAMT